MRSKLTGGLLILPMLLSTQCYAGWTLDKDQSVLHYVTSKASAVSEVNSFTSLDGAISDSGRASLSISLGSVETGIEIRNQRMQEIVFETGAYPEATVSLNVDSGSLKAMASGTSFTAEYPATLDLHGIQQELTAQLQVSKMADGSIQVTSASPILLPAGQFGLAEAVEQLREIAGLPSINPNVVVSFSLNFQAD